MHILHIASEHPPLLVFGLGRYVCELARAQAVLGHTIHILTNSIGGTDQDVIEAGVHLHRVDYPPPPKPPGMIAPPLAFNLHLQQRATKLGLKRLGNPDVVISHDWLTVSAGYRLSKRWKLPHFWTVHDTVLGKIGGHLQNPSDILSSGIERWAARSADLILVNSQMTQREIELGYGGDPKKIRLLHCGVHVNTFNSDQTSQRLSIFRQLFAAPDEILFTYVGRLSIEKGIDTLINAFSSIRAQGIQARLAIVGTGSLEPVIREHISKNGISDVVSMHGYLRGDVLSAFYAVSDVHICPSHYEPFGLVAVEAMAAGTPVIVSKTGGLEEIVHHPSIGRTCVPQDIGSLATAMIELARSEHLRNEIGSAGAEHVRNQFDWSIIAKQSIVHYQQFKNCSQ